MHPQLLKFLSKITQNLQYEQITQFYSLINFISKYLLH
jgi:hypothetical protein